MKVIIKKSTNPKKKYMAVFYENKKKVKTTHFGFLKLNLKPCKACSKIQSTTFYRTRPMNARGIPILPR